MSHSIYLEKEEENGEIVSLANLVFTCVLATINIL